MKKILMGLMIVSSFSVLASDCKVLITENAEYYGGRISQAVSDESLSERQLSRVGYDADVYDYEIEIQGFTDSSYNVFATMALTTKPDYSSDDDSLCEELMDQAVFSTSTFVKKDELDDLSEADFKAAANRLIKSSVNCELLKEFESELNRKRNRACKK